MKGAQQGIILAHWTIGAQQWGRLRAAQCGVGECAGEWAGDALAENWQAGVERPSGPMDWPTRL